jgi:hypothetical protein
MFSADVKQSFLNMINNNMDKAKDLSFLNWIDMPEKKKTMRVAIFVYLHIPVIYNWVIYTFLVSKRKPEDGENEEPIITYTKRAKLASLAGFDVEVKLSQYVPKDTNFSLWLNVARKKCTKLNIYFICYLESI